MQNSKTPNYAGKENKPYEKAISNAFLRAKKPGKHGRRSMTGWLIVVLVVVVVGAVFLTLYQGSITEIWDSIVDKITGHFELIEAKRPQRRGSGTSPFSFKTKKKNKRRLFTYVSSLKNKMQRLGRKTKNALAKRGRRSDDRLAHVDLVVVVVGAVFLTLYQGSITEIWDSIVDKITGLLS